LFGSSIAISVAGSISYADASNDEPQRRGLDLRLDVTLIVDTGLGTYVVLSVALLYGLKRVCENPLKPVPFKKNESLRIL
jgi:hypothetical protein